MSIKTNCSVKKTIKMVAHHISDCYMYTYRACSEHNTKPIHVIPTEKYKKVSESIITTTVFIKR